MEVSIIASKDTHIEVDNPTLNNGGETSFKVGEDYTSSNNFRSLLFFDLSEIQSDANIISAKISLYRSIIRSNNLRTLRVFRLKKDWVELEATWNICSTGNNWQTAGSEGANDRESTDIGSLSLDTETLGWFDFILDESKIQEMLSEGSFSNKGFILKNDVELDDASKFFSREYMVDPALRPKLVIEFEAQDPKPHPINLRLNGIKPEIMNYQTSIRIRAARRDSFLRTKKKGIR